MDKIKLQISKLTILAVIFVVLAATAAHASDWTQFRGERATGIATDAKLPATFSETENLVWKTPLPGFGASSPIICNGKIFLTAYSGYGTGDEDATIDSLRLHVLCYDLTTGKEAWTQEIKPRLPESPYSGFITHHGYASSTPVTDGELLYTFFGKSGVYAWTFDGKQVWHTNETGEGLQKLNWGTGTSPILADNLLIVNASVESSKVLALDKKTGKVVWSYGPVPMSWSSPTLATLKNGSKQVLVTMKNKMVGLELATGKELWNCALGDDYVCPTPIQLGDENFAMGMVTRNGYTMVVKLDGSGDVTKTGILWDLQATTHEATPIYLDGRIYWVTAKGIAQCFDAKTGEELYKERLFKKRTMIYGSPVLADGKIFITDRKGITMVYATGPDFKELGSNQFTSDESTFNATAAVAGTKMVLRSNQFLYCIGK